MKLLVTIPSLEVGGAEIFLGRLLGYLAEKKGVQVFLLDFEREKRDPELIRTFSDKITLIHNPLGNLFLKKLFGKIEHMFKLENDLLSYKFYSVFLRNTIRKHKIGLIHSHLYRSDKIIARCVSGIPTVTTLHGCYNLFGPERSEEMIRILSSFKKIVYIADRNLEPFKQLSKKEELLKRTVKIYNGLNIDASVRSSVTKDQGLPRILVVTRCIPEKGWDIVLEAVKRLNKEQASAELELVGDGDYLNSLKQKYAGEPHVLFSGKVIDVASRISEAAICCFPSVYPNESFPNSILEYMMHKKPIISNRIGEVEHMLTMENGEYCALLAPANASHAELVDFYCQSIRELLQDRSKRERLARMAGENIKKFDLSHTADAYLKLYNTLQEN
jgi:glycosyltransferase involved in cell wall biosynthesis